MAQVSFVFDADEEAERVRQHVNCEDAFYQLEQFRYFLRNREKHTKLGKYARKELGLVTEEFFRVCGPVMNASRGE